MIKLLRVNHKHVNEIVHLATQRYSAMLAYCPVLPKRYTEPDAVIPLLQSIIGAAPGVVAYDEGRMVGYIMGWILGEFRGYPTVFSPELGNGTLIEGSRRIYEAMYTYIANIWLGEGYTSHIISQYTDRPDILNMWHWLGFGFCAADGVRDLHPLDLTNGAIKIKRASVDELDVIYDLGEALSRHISSTPTFLYSDHPMPREEIHKLLTDEHQIFWLAFKEDQVVGFLRHGPASDDASTIIRDPGTTSIRGLYTVPEARGQNVGSSLLNQTFIWAKAHGYKRCCVDFEPMNVLATRFWTRYFQTSTLACIRHFDPRATTQFT